MIQKPTPHQGSREGHVPSLIVIHGDAGRTDAGTVSWIQNPGSEVSYHYLVGRDGEIYQFVDEAKKAWHAGISKFNGEEIRRSVNHISIGVCFANNGLGDEDYRDIQYEVGGELVAGICGRHGITINRIRGHNEVSPGRKRDPWRWFDWQRFYREISRHMGAA